MESIETALALAKSICSGMMEGIAWSMSIWSVNAKKASILGRPRDVLASIVIHTAT